MIFLQFSRNLISVCRNKKTLIFITKHQLSSFVKPILKTDIKMSGMILTEVVNKLNEFAKEDLAGTWDNVGLLIEPFTPRNIERIMLTNDLTEVVMNEALKKNADMIISYHPPIFGNLKRITQKSWKEKLVSICLENRIAVYSPHTAWDSVLGGVNDWLSKSLPILESKPITAHIDYPEIGPGRLCTIEGEINLKESIDKIKKHIKLDHLQVSIAVNGSLESSIKTVAICAGSGSSILKSVKADLYLTGEMSHHEVLDAIHNGANVILCNHSNSERGFLNEFKILFEKMVDNSVKIFVSESDCDPLRTY